MNAVLPAVETTNIKLSENLSASATEGSVYSQQIKVIDLDGRTVSSTIFFKKMTAPDPANLEDNSGEWGIFINQDPTNQDDLAPTTTIEFDAEGNPTTDITSIDIPTNTDVDNPTQITVDFDFSNLTHLRGATTAVVDPNGNTEGKLESYNISTTGEINGIYSNGEISLMGQIAIANLVIQQD